MADTKLHARTVVLTSILLLSGCLGGAGSPWPHATETLMPQIAEDGSKFFTFRREYTEAFVSFESSPVDQSRNQRPRRPPAVTPRLEEVLELTGYCRDGYFELYRQQERQALSIRGECREGASEEDRERFGNGTLLLGHQAGSD